MEDPVFPFSPLGTGHGSLYTRPRTAKFYFNKDTCVKAKVKSQVTGIILCISLPSESWNDSGKVSSGLKTILITGVAKLRFLELWGRGTSSLIQPTPTKYIFCFEASKRHPPTVISTPACMIAEDQNMNPQRICVTLSHSIVRDATQQYSLCRSPINDAILATRSAHSDKWECDL